MTSTKQWVFAFFLLFSGASFGQTASDVAVDYFKALQDGDYAAAAGFFSENALRDFREMMSFTEAMPEEGRQSFVETFFGAGATAESVAALSDAAFFSAFLGAIMNKAEAVGGLDLEGIQVLGEVPEGENVAHVVTRNKMRVGEIEIESMDVVSFEKSGDQWKALMSGKMDGLARQLRAAMSNETP